MDIINYKPILYILGVILYLICAAPFKETIMDSRSTLLGRLLGSVLLLIYPITISIIYINNCLKRLKTKKKK